MDNDDISVADLEIYSLSIRSIETLDRLGVLYVHQLNSQIEQQLREIPRAGALVLRELPIALANWRAKRPVKTIQQCLENQNDD
jgi:DNA-directed RNA polymerase alpha subunit